jgi:hypothetical protein
LSLVPLHVALEPVNRRSRKFLLGSCNERSRHSFALWKKEMKEEEMRKLTYAIAALATLAVGAPTLANAAGVGIYVGGDRDYYGDRYDGPRARFYEHDRGWHRGWYHHDYHGDRGVVIRNHHWNDDY